MRGVRRAFVGALLALVVAACGGTSQPTPGPDASRTPIATPAAAATPTAAVATTPTEAPTPVPTARPDLPPIIEVALLAVLPDTVGASLVEEDLDREMTFAADSSRGAEIVGFAAAVVGDAGENIATVSLARIDTSDPAGFFDRWRADFDEAACAANGGAGKRETRQIGGRTVALTTCLGGAFVYHVRLRGQTLIVSILSLGAGDFGARLIEGLSE